MKRLALLLLMSFSVKALLAQGQYPDINKSLETVIQKFSSGLEDIKGEVISTRQQTTEYHSKINITGASPAVITEEQMPGRKLVYWKSVLYTGTDAEAVKTKYKEVFNLINNSIIKSDSQKPFILSGKFREPFLARSATSHFELLPATGDLKDIKVDLVLDRSSKINSLYVIITGKASIR